MIAVSSSGKSFRALAAYLAKGRDGASPERVVWSTARNLPTAEPELAATFMRATASKNDRVDKPVYHLVLSFDPSDPIDRIGMERVADRVLERLRLSGHQAVIVSHGDRVHSHVHIFVNRVHPETGVAWERWKDQPTIQAVLREQEVALGLRPVTSSLEHPVERDRTPATGIQLGGRARAHEDINPSASSRASASGTTAQKLDQLLQHIGLYARVDEMTQDLGAAMFDSEAARARSVTVALQTQRAASAQREFCMALTPVYRNADEAFRAFESYAASRGVREALDTLRDHPGKFGELRTAERTRAFGLVKQHDDSAARGAAHDAARLGVVAASASRDAFEVNEESRVRRLESEFVRQLRTLYTNSDHVRREFMELVQQHGMEDAVSLIVANPAALGELKRSIEITGADTAERAREVAALGMEAMQARTAWNLRKLTTEGPVITIAISPMATSEAARDLKDSIERERSLRAELRRSPGESALRERIGTTVARLLPHEVRTMANTFTAPQLALAMRLKESVKEVLLGRDERAHD